MTQAARFVETGDACQNSLMSPPLRELLALPRVLGDGAYGTALQQALLPGERVEQLNLRAPEQVRGLAEAYVAAGAQAIWSNTFGLGLEGFPATEAIPALRAGVDIARAAAGKTRAVFAALGPLAPHLNDVAGTYTRLGICAREASADAVMLETALNADMTQRAVAACVKAGVPVAVSFTLRRAATGHLETHDGMAWPEAALRAADAGAFAVGVNCCDGPSTVRDGISALASVVALPLIARPNTGVPHVCSPQHFADAADVLYRCGVWLVGGCCGTTPEHIAAVRARCVERR